MSKVKKAWFCQNCGAESSKWLGRCPSCGEWNTFAEEIISAPGRQETLTPAAKAVPIGEISTAQQERISLNNTELERILGGGLVPGSVVLLGGEPGIGKSTLSLQIPLHAPHCSRYMCQGRNRPARSGCALKGSWAGRTRKKCRTIAWCCARPCWKTSWNRRTLSSLPC
ncbi:MAG: hypothetical protein LC132_01540 [Burkholderiales bacterium]|nr:hypothetical protein [Burkholderiales bacterium]